MRGVGSIAGGGFAQATARMAGSAYGVAKSSVAAVNSGHPLAESAPGGVARGQLARHVSPPLDSVPFPGYGAATAAGQSAAQTSPMLEAAAAHAGYHGEAGAVADVTKQTIAQVGSVNAYKTYLSVFRADDEIQSSLVKITA